MRTINFPDNYSVHQKWSALYQCYKEGKPIVGTITQYSEHFGFTVSIDGILAHMDKYEFTFAYIEDHEVYTYLMEFRDDDDEAYSKQILQENDMNTDVSTMTEKELFNYLRGEYLLGGRLSSLMNGLAAIQVESY